MAYYPPELAMLGPALGEEELDEMVQVQLNNEGNSDINSEINLYSRFSAETGPVNQRRDYNNTFEEFMSRQTRPIPMPMPGHDQQLREPDLDTYLDTPYQLQTLGPSLSSYTEYEEHYNLAGVEGLNLDATSSILPPSSESTMPNCPDDVEVKQSDSSESQAYYGTENVVRELKMEYVRWFYKTDSDKNWLPFTGYDSMRIESRHRELVLREEEEAECNARSGIDLENESVERRQNLSNNRGYQMVNNSTPIPVDTSSTCKQTQSSQQHEQQSSSTIPGKGNNSRTKRVYRSFTRKWLEWSGPNGGSGGSNGSPKSENPSAASTCNRLQWPPVPPPTHPENIIIVRGGLYEVDLENNICYATYWPDLCQICRGTWFYDGTWQPIDSVHADKLEIEHLEKFGGASLVTPHVEVLPESLSPTKKNKQVAHRVSFSDFHVDWTSATEIILYSKAVFKMSSILQILSLRGGHRICRGYFKPCMLSDRPAEINHIVFVVHGIGQKMDTGRIVRNCAAFRDCVTTLKKSCPQSDVACRQKAEFFPVEWRSAAKLDGDIVDSITPHKLLGLRQMLNATAMDIMYYTSPLYGETIQNALRSELNRIYSNFVKRNPNFEARGGKVSVLAHSLGAVITYDIMTTTLPELRSAHLSTEMNGMDTNEEINHQGILVIDDVTSDKMPEQPRLLFKLEHFICLGSPLAVFLALRWKEPHNPDLRSYILPPNLCKRIYNVFHPSDPVAYRLEPLLNKYYMKIAPLLIHPSGSAVKRKYDDMEKEFINRDLPPPPQPSKFEGPSTSTAYHHHQQSEPSQQSQNQPNSFKSTTSNLHRFSTVPVPPYSSSSGMHTTGPTTSAAYNSSSLKSPPTPLTPTKENNWSWFNLMKWNWKSPENQNEFNEVSAIGPPSEFNDVGPLQQQPDPDSPETSMNVHLNSPPAGLNHQGEYRREAGDEHSSHSVVPPVPNDLEYRMDFVLRESNLSSSYLAALTSHTSYWTTLDVADFFLDIIETSN